MNFEEENTMVSEVEQALNEVWHSLPERYCDKRVGSRIAKRRKELGFTQKDLAGPNYTAAYISRVENNERTPSLQLLLRLALVLDINPEYLAFGRSNKEIGKLKRHYALVFIGVPEDSLRAARPKSKAR
jgi:transcriptional regulator with XRE-family HTH domain